MALLAVLYLVCIALVELILNKIGAGDVAMIAAGIILVAIFFAVGPVISVLSNKNDQNA